MTHLFLAMVTEPIMTNRIKHFFKKEELELMNGMNYGRRKEGIKAEWISLG